MLEIMRRMADEMQSLSSVVFPWINITWEHMLHRFSVITVGCNSTLVTTFLHCNSKKECYYYLLHCKCAFFFVQFSEYEIGTAKPKFSACLQSSSYLIQTGISNSFQRNRIFMNRKKAYDRDLGFLQWCEWTTCMK